MAKFDVLFTDWSGCVSNDLSQVYAAHTKIIESFGKTQIPLDEWKRIFTSTERLYTFFGIYDLRDVNKMFRENFDAIVNAGSMPAVYSDAPAMLEKISKEMPIIVVSAHLQHQLEAEAERYGVRKFITKIYGEIGDKAESIVREKGARRAIFVEDMVQGIRAGKRAQVPVAAVTRGYHFLDMLLAENADYYINDLKGLENIIF